VSDGIIIHPTYKNLAQDLDGVRYFIVTGGRGSGKSFAINTLLTGRVLAQDDKVLFTRYTMASAHQSIIPEFIEKIELLGANDYFGITKSEIVSKASGGTVYFSGIKTSSGDQTARLKSLHGFNYWVLDEAEELNDETTFDKIDLSIRVKDKPNNIILILNPTTKEHWIYKRFFEDRGVNEGFNGVKGDTCYIHTTYLDNIKNLSDSYIKQIDRIRETNPNKYKHQILGGWRDKSEGVIFTNWELGDYPKDVQSIYGMDFGFSIDPTTIIATHIDKDKRIIYLKELLYQPELTTSDIARIASKLVSKGLIIADSAEPRLIKELISKGLNIKAAVKGQGSVTGGIALMQDYKLVIDHESKNLVKELNNYCWLEKKSETPIDDYNHLIDAARYSCSFQLMKPNAGKYAIR